MKMEIVDDNDLVELDYLLDGGKKIAIIGYNGIQKFDNVDILPFTVDLFDRDQPFSELPEILDELYHTYDGIVIISDRKRITKFELPHVQLIPKDINIELEIVAVLDRKSLLEKIKKLLDDSNLLEHSLNKLYLSDRSRVKPDYDGIGIPLENVLRRNFPFKDVESLEELYEERQNTKEFERFKNYIVEPQPIEKINLIQVYRENEHFNFSKTLQARVINEKDLKNYEFNSRLKQLILTSENDLNKLEELNLPQYLEYIILNEESKDQELIKILDRAKRGYEILIIEHDESDNRVLTDLIDYLNKYAERFKIYFSENTSYLSQVGLTTDTEVCVIDCSLKNRRYFYKNLEKALEDDQIIVFENLPEDEEDLLIESWEMISEYRKDSTPMAMFFAAGPIITQAFLLAKNSLPYTASRILIGNSKTDRTRIDRYLIQKDS